LVVVSAAAGLEGEPLKIRREIDEAGAGRIEREGVGAYLDGWLEDPVFGTTRLDEPSRTADRALRMENNASGLAAALRGLGQGTLPRVPVEDIACPILWVAGAVDAAYVATMSALAAPRGEALVVIPGVGHNVIAETPAAVADAITAWRS
ncbi:MAG: alpha/beta fold hydrolase, partial [Actinomycetota bacterium]|nr:alpha/beta fold hydrolase [Actinomycetota bacterium]